MITTPLKYHMEGHSSIFLVFIVCPTELKIDDTKLWRVHKVGYPEKLGGGGGSSALVENLVELSVV